MLIKTIDVRGNSLDVTGLTKEGIAALRHLARMVKDDCDAYALLQSAKDDCDNTLTKKEMITILESKYAEVLKQEYRPTPEDKKRLKEEEYEKKQREQQEIMNEWKMQNLKVVNLVSFETPKQLLHILMKSSGMHGLLLEGKNGLGKSYTMIAEMQALAKTMSIDYEPITGQITPLGIYQKLYDINTRIKASNLTAFNVVLDDCAGLTKSEIAVNLLKGALWGVADRRILTYKSNHKNMENYPEMFELDPRLKITIITNKFKDKDENILALKGRCLYHKFQFKYHEIIELMESIVQNDYKGVTLEQRNKVLEFLKKNTDEATDNLNFRLLIKGFEFIKLSDVWEDLLKSQIEQDEAKQIVIYLEAKEMKVWEKVQVFCEMTGMSRSTYHNIKKEMGLSRGWHKC